MPKTEFCLKAWPQYCSTPLAGRATGGKGLNWEQNDTNYESKSIHSGAILAPRVDIDTALDIRTSILKFEYRYQDQAQELQIDLTAFKRFPWWSHLIVLIALPFLMA